MVFTQEWDNKPMKQNNPEIDPCLYKNLTYDKVDTEDQWRKESVQQLVVLR